jgi:hypothetical protein
MSGEIFDLSGDPSEGIVCYEAVLDEKRTREQHRLGKIALSEDPRLRKSAEAGQFGYSDPEVEAWKANGARLVAQKALAAARKTN